MCRIVRVPKGARGWFQDEELRGDEIWPSGMRFTPRDWIEPKPKKVRCRRRPVVIEIPYVPPVPVTGGREV